MNTQALLRPTFAALTYFAIAIGATHAADLRVMTTGLGSGSVNSTTPGINCGADCDETYAAATMVTLTATPAVGSTFVGFAGDCSGASCTVNMNQHRSVRAEFAPSTAIPTLSDFTPAGIGNYLTANPGVTTAAQFVKALPLEFKQNWILMSRSESLQTGTAEMPRILMPSANAQFVFTVGMTTHSSYPGAHPNAIEYMQWDPTEKNFRFHEIVLDAIPAMGSVPARTRGISVDDDKCSKCHSTRNVLNRSTFPGTTGIPVGLVKAKNKPNWDTYDSWGGMTPFNRDRIYQGSVEAAAFRRLFNLWTWRANAPVRSLMEQLELQPPGVPAAHVITRTVGGANDGHINFAFDATPPVLSEPAPTGSVASVNVAYSFNGVAGTPPGTSVTRGGSFATLHHSGTPTSDEGRGVQLFDILGGLDGNLNQQRIADEVASHRFATGSVPIEIRPIALAIAKRCLNINAGTNTVESATATPALPALTIDQSFFTARNGLSINDVVNDTRARAQNLTRRKADIQKLDLDRTGDPYLVAASNGLIQQYGAATSFGVDTSLARIRQEVFRRPIDAGVADATVMGGVYVDRELYSYNTNRLALYRFFLEPLGVSVDKWSMGVRGRSRTYTFADVFGSYENVLQPTLEASLTSNPVAGLAAPYSCASLINAVNATLASLPASNAVPTFTDVQRIFNKSCIECHGGLGYPPYGPGFLDLSEDENPPATTPPLVSPRLARSYENAVALTTTNPATSYLYQRIIATSENCPGGVMPCGGPPLSKTDVETIRRWIVGPSSRPSTAGDPHIKTVTGVNYDFQSAGEFVLLRDEFLEVQARQTAVSTEAPLPPNAHTGLASCVSVNSAVAVRVGPHRITYQPNLSGQPDPEGLQLRIDGKLQRLAKQGIPLPSGARIMTTAAPGGIQIEAPGGAKVIVTPNWWNHYQLWYMNIDIHDSRATQGVMGAIAPNNWLPALPDGSSLGPRPSDLHQRHVDLYEKFADAWRVTDGTSLFDYASGTSTATFTIDNWPVENAQSCIVPRDPEGPAAIPPVKPVALDVARQHCRAIVADDRRANCEADVMATGEAGFAKTYLLTEQIDRNAPPDPPVLTFPENHAVGIGVDTVFTWNGAGDADDDRVTYRHCVWDALARPNANDDCSGARVQTVAWSPGLICALIVLLVGAIVLGILMRTGLRQRSGLLRLIALLFLILAILAFYWCGVRNAPASARITALESGKAYLWKVIAEDGKGGVTESETRRFTAQ